MSKNVPLHVASLLGFLVLCAAASPAQASPAYFRITTECLVFVFPGGDPEGVEYAWLTDWECTNDGPFDAPPDGVTYNIKMAVLAPDSLGSPTKIRLDVGEIGGLSVAPSLSVSSEVSALHPPKPGMTWYGFVSSDLITFGLEGEVEVSTDYGWEGLPLGSENSTGAAWISDNLDDLGFADVTDGFTLLQPFSVVVVPAVPLDIKPGSCPNSLNRSSHGVLPVALMGTEEVDVAEVDLSTVRISRADGVGGSVAPNEGPPGPHSVLEDVATPFDGEGCECHDLGGDGIDDLSMKFKTRNLVDALELSDLSGGAVVELVLSGNLLDGTPFVASDCIVIVPRGNLAPANAFVGSNVSDTFVAVTPIDLNFDDDGFADFSRSYYSGTALTLTPPARSDGRRFVRWSVDGVLQELGVRTLELVVDQDVNLRAIYKRGRRPRPDRPMEDDGSVE